MRGSIRLQRGMPQTQVFEDAGWRAWTELSLCGIQNVFPAYRSVHAIYGKGTGSLSAARQRDVLGKATGRIHGTEIHESKCGVPVRKWPEVQTVLPEGMLICFGKGPSLVTN